MTDLAALADAYGTPLYVYDLDEVTAAHDDLVSVLPRGSQLYYSVKANPHPVVVEHLRSLGAALEVSSTGELAIASAAGEGQVLVTGPVRTPVEVAALAALPAPPIVSVESPRARELVGRAVPGAVLLLRVNLTDVGAGYGLAMAGRASKFGVDAEAILDDPGATLGTGGPGPAVAGLHFYSGTNLVDLDNLVVSAAAAVSFVGELHRRTGWSPSVLDLGGGFGHPYGTAGARPAFSGFGDAVQRHVDALGPAGRPCLLFESGRSLVAGAGTLALRVMDVKESRGHRVVLLDGGVNCAAGSQAVSRLADPNLDVCRVDARGAPSIDGAVPAIVGGPLCTTIDVLGRRIDPAVRPGDIVAIPNLGAYGLSAALVGFLGHAIATEVVVAAGEVVDASRLALARVPAERVRSDRGSERW